MVQFEDFDVVMIVKCVWRSSMKNRSYIHNNKCLQQLSVKHK